MSRSYRRPYAAVCGKVSAKEDKRMASRGVRRTQNRWLRTLKGYDEDRPIPHRLECFHNDVYGWTRDGHQFYQGLTGRNWSRYIESLNPHYAWEKRYYQKHPPVWPPEWYVDLKRK